MNPLLVMLLTFLAGTMLVLGIFSILADLFLRDRSRFSRRVDDEFRMRLRDEVRKSSLFKEGALEAEALRLDEGNPGVWQRFEAMVSQSGLHLTAGRLLVVMALSAAVPGALGFFLHGVFAAVVLVALGGALPWLYVYLKRKRRLEKLLSQLPDTFDLMARVIRAGQTVPQAMQAVADEFDPPVASEISYCYEQQNLGLSPELAYRDLARRTGLLEVKIFVLAMLVQQQSGGNLAELLDKLAFVVRERFRVRGKIRVLTAEGRVQAAVLLALPPALLLVIMLLNPRYGQVLFNHPNLLIAMFVSEAFGALWIRRIINFDF
jgi:tight adherence protein B